MVYDAEDAAKTLPGIASSAAKRNNLILYIRKHFILLFLVQRFSVISIKANYIPEDLFNIFSRKAACIWF